MSYFSKLLKFLKVDSCGLNKFTSCEFMWALYFLATLTFVFSLWYPYIGEEGVYTITSMEMWSRHNFLIPFLYGDIYGRPPLYNWLIILISNVVGWSNVLVAARIVTALATTVTGLVLAWLVKSLTKDKILAAFCALIFISGDVLFYRGWLAYSDPLFGLLIFSAIACLWVGLEANKKYLIWLAVCLITCGALTKVQTAYIFYIISICVLYFDINYRKNILSPNFILSHIFGFGLFLGWYCLLTHGANATTSHDITLKLFISDWRDYFNQLWSFPLETWARFLPASGLVLYWIVRKKIAIKVTRQDWFFYTILIFIFNWVPYWIGPSTTIRYIVPIYPLAALILGVFLFQVGGRGVLLMIKWFVAMLVLKIFFCAFAFPWYQNHYRGNYNEIAKDILIHTNNLPIYVVDQTAMGLSVVATIDAMIYPKSPLVGIPNNINVGFVLVRELDPKFGKLIATYKSGGQHLFLCKIKK